MKKLWMIIALVLLLLIGYVGVTTWLNQQKQGLSEREFTVDLADIPAEYTAEIGGAIERNTKAKLKAMTFDAAAPVYTGSTLAVAVPNGITNARLLEAFNQELVFDVMMSAPLEEADVVILETQGFKQAGITEEHIRWVMVGSDDAGNAAMRIILSEEGQNRLQELYTELDGEEIGLFIRGQLVAKLLVKSAEFEQDIRIFNIPDLTLATTVADDLLVGRYVTFSQ